MDVNKKISVVGNSQQLKYFGLISAKALHPLLVTPNLTIIGRSGCVPFPENTFFFHVLYKSNGLRALQGIAYVGTIEKIDFKSIPPCPGSLFLHKWE